MANVGFSTGSLHKTNIPFNERIELYHSLGADAIELSFGTPNQLLNFQLSEQIINILEKFAFISIHAPCKEVRYDNSFETHKIIDKLKTLCGKPNIRGLVLHPDNIDNYEILDQSGLPFLLENMDRRKSYGTHPEQFQKLKNKYNFGFVLDVEHAYEHDSSMQLAKEFVDVMGDGLKHMHVSGCNNAKMHVPTYQAINKEAIAEILKMNLNVPIILEGSLFGDIQNSIKEELEYIRSDFKTSPIS